MTTVSKEDGNFGRKISLRMRVADLRVHVGKLIFLPKLSSSLLTVVNRKLPIIKNSNKAKQSVYLKKCCVFISFQICNHLAVQSMFEAMSQCQALHPDPEDEQSPDNYDQGDYGELRRSD